MRLVQVTVPDDQREDVVAVLREYDLGLAETEGSGESADETILTFLVPADAVEHVLADLTETGFDREGYVVSLEAEWASFEGVDAVQNRWAKTPNRLAPAALRSKAKDLRRNTRSYLWMMALAAVVATAGLLMGSPAVVVGSMVIAPIVSPALTASVGAVRNDREMLVDSVHQQGVGLGVAVVTAALFGWTVQQVEAVPASLAIEQMGLMAGRLSPSILAIVVGLAAGAAGAYGLATKGQATIVGVMIAAALIPTAAAVGIGVAWGNAVVALGALLLLVLSLIAVNVGGTSMLLYLDYRPDGVDADLLSVSGARQTLVVGVTALVVLGTVLTTGVAFYRQSDFERTVNDALADVLDGSEYDGLGVRSTSIEYLAPSLSGRTEVTVTLARTTDRDYPDLPNALDREVSNQTGRDVRVAVRYVDYDQSGTGVGAPSSVAETGTAGTGIARESIPTGRHGTVPGWRKAVAF